MLFTLHHSNPVRDTAQKSFPFGGDMKSDLVQCKRGLRLASLPSAIKRNKRNFVFRIKRSL